MEMNPIMEAIGRRGFVNNLITAALVGTALYIVFSPTKTLTPARSAKVGEGSLLKNPTEGNVTSKAYLDISIGGEPAGRVVLGMLDFELSRMHRSVPCEKQAMEKMRMRT